MLKINSPTSNPPEPPLRPERPAKPPVRKPRTQAVIPIYEYRLESFTEATENIIFQTLGAQGWRFAGRAPSGKAVFERSRQ